MGLTSEIIIFRYIVQLKTLYHCSFNQIIKSGECLYFKNKLFLLISFKSYGTCLQDTGIGVHKHDLHYGHVLFRTAVVTITLRNGNGARRGGRKAVRKLGSPRPFPRKNMFYQKICEVFRFTVRRLGYHSNVPGYVRLYCS